MRRFGYPIPSAIGSGRPKVVILDNDAKILSALERILARPFSVTLYREQTDAFIAVGPSQPAALVLEIAVPGLDELRLLGRLTVSETSAHMRMVSTRTGRICAHQPVSPSQRVLRERRPGRTQNGAQDADGAGLSLESHSRGWLTGTPRHGTGWRGG